MSATTPKKKSNTYPAPKDYDQRLSRIRNEAAPTLAKVDEGDFDWRDVAILTEYLGQFGNVLDEMIDNPPVCDQLNTGEIAEIVTELT